MSIFGSGDPDNPMGGLLGDLLKVIGSGPGAGDNWFEAARTLAYGVATDGGEDESPDPLVRIAFEELARVAELHVAEATGIGPTSGSGGVAFEAVGPGQWSFRVLEAYRRVLKSMIDAQQQGAAAVPTSMDLSELDPEGSAGLGGLLGQFALTLGPVFLGMQFGSAAGHLARRAFGQYALPLPWPESPTLLLVPGNVARFAEDWSLPLQEVQLWVCVRELTMHAVLTRPGVRSLAHDAARRRVGARRRGAAVHRRTARRGARGPDRARGRAGRSRGAALGPHQPRAAQHLEHADRADHGDRRLRGPRHRRHRASLTSSHDALREAWYRYRIEEGKGEQAFAGLFGLDMGQDEVDRGRDFVNGVVERAGEDALARLWRDELDLPTPAEVDAPGLWLARIGLLD